MIAVPVPGTQFLRPRHCSCGPPSIRVDQAAARPVWRWPSGHRSVNRTIRRRTSWHSCGRWSATPANKACRIRRTCAGDSPSHRHPSSFITSVGVGIGSAQSFATRVSAGDCPSRSSASMLLRTDRLIDRREPRAQCEVATGSPLTTTDQRYQFAVFGRNFPASHLAFTICR